MDGRRVHEILGRGKGGIFERRTLNSKVVEGLGWGTQAEAQAPWIEFKGGSRLIN